MRACPPCTSRCASAGSSRTPGSRVLDAEERRDPVFRAEYDRLAAEHARELDDRPADKLAAIAADMEREQYGSLRDLTAERFGRPTRGAA